MSVLTFPKRPHATSRVYQWHLGMVDETIEINGRVVDNPARKNAIFVVHGMGKQKWTDTAALLRSGFEDVLEESNEENPTTGHTSLASPFIQEGFWADYDNLESTFPEEAEHFDKGKTEFFSRLWRSRTFSAARSFRWFLKQQLKLVHPSVIWKVHPVAWLLYIPLQLASFSLFSFLLIFRRRMFAEVLGDVRLYTDPRGTIERAIVQRIDKRVGEKFLQMIGLDWNFRPLKESGKVMSNGNPVIFDRIIWVAHSLGTVISYNVLSDLFCRADDIESTGDRIQKKGVRKFRDSLRRFITIGSPLDKIAFLLGEDAVKPWPREPRVDLVRSSYVERGGEDRLRDLWVNFYQVFDPVSGALQNRLICGDEPPMNFHIGLWRFPGLAHVSYWRDRTTLRYILSRLYGEEFLPAAPLKVHSAVTLTLLAFIGYVVWAIIVLMILDACWLVLSPIVLWLIEFLQTSVLPW